MMSPIQGLLFGSSDSLFTCCQNHSNTQRRADAIRSAQRDRYCTAQSYVGGPTAVTGAAAAVVVVAVILRHLRFSNNNGIVVWQGDVVFIEMLDLNVWHLGRHRGTW